MSIISLVGFIGAIGGFLYAMWIEDQNGTDLLLYWNAPGMSIVVIGALGATLLKSTAADARAAVSLGGRAFTTLASPVKLIDQLVEFADIARKDGLIALESQQIKHPFLSKGVQLLVDGQKPEIVIRTLEAESDSQKQREKHGSAVWAYLGEVSPAMGMVGTLVGLVALLGNMDDQTALLTGMASALLTTLYGALLANSLALPIASKIRVQSELEGLNREILIEGISFIQTGGNPRVLADLLVSYISPTQEAQLAINSR